MTRQRWTGNRDGVGHLETARGPRTACGLAATGEQHGWPVSQRCLDCLALEATSHLPEALLLAGYGVRPGVPIG